MGDTVDVRRVARLRFWIDGVTFWPRRVDRRRLGIACVIFFVIVTSGTTRWGWAPLTSAWSDVLVNLGRRNGNFQVGLTAGEERGLCCELLAYYPNNEERGNKAQSSC